MICETREDILYKNIAEKEWKFNFMKDHNITKLTYKNSSWDLFVNFKTYYNQFKFD